MEPKDKALELIKIYTNYSYTNLFPFREESNWNYARKCALVCVDEIIKNCQETTKLYEFYDLINSNISDQPLEYWKQVKEEINNFKEITK